MQGIGVHNVELELALRRAELAQRLEQGQRLHEARAAARARTERSTGMQRIKRTLAAVVVAVSLVVGGGGTALVAHALPHVLPGVLAGIKSNM